MYNKLYLARENSQINYSYYILSIDNNRDVGEYTSNENNLKNNQDVNTSAVGFFLKVTFLRKYARKVC